LTTTPLFDRVISLSTPGLITPPSISSVKVIAGGMPPDSLLEEFLELMKPIGSERALCRDEKQCLVFEWGAEAGVRYG